MREILKYYKYLSDGATIRTLGDVSYKLGARSLLFFGVSGGRNNKYAQ